MAKGNILIAEDDVVLRNLYIKKFSMQGYEVRTAEDGAQTIEMIKAAKPDILLCDIHMPNVDGFQVLQSFPQKGRGFPVIVLTNFDQPEFKLRAEELGADDYFVKKDMTIRSLVEMVEKLLTFKANLIASGAAPTASASPAVGPANGAAAVS